MGHTRAAGNCWTLADYRASFSNLNYWPVHQSLNSVHWRLLKDHIRKESIKFKRVFATTGSITISKGKDVGEYVKGVYKPSAFYWNLRMQKEKKISKPTKEILEEIASLIEENRGHLETN